MTPKFKLSYLSNSLADNDQGNQYVLTDLTDRINSRLIEVEVTDVFGYMNDTLSFTLDDGPPYFDIPTRGQIMKVELGYEETQLYSLGYFFLEDAEITNSKRAGEQITMHGHSHLNSGMWLSERTTSFHRIQLSELLKRCADFCKFKLAISAGVKDLGIVHEDQIKQSTSEFLISLGHKHGFVANAKLGESQVTTLFVQKENALTNQDTAQKVTFDVTDVSNIRTLAHGTEYYAEVRAMWDNKNDEPDYAHAYRDPVNPMAGSIPPTKVFTLSDIYPSKEKAEAACQSWMDRLTYSEATLTFECIGHPEILSSCIITITNLRPGVPNVWFVTEVRHRINKREGFTSSFSCELPYKFTEAPDEKSEFAPE